MHIIILCTIQTLSGEEGRSLLTPSSYWCMPAYNRYRELAIIMYRPTAVNFDTVSFVYVIVTALNSTGVTWSVYIAYSVFSACYFPLSNSFR